MSELQITARLKIHDGKLDQFKRLAKACVESTRAKDQGTLQYDWYFNEDHTECVVRERYVDSDSLLAHIANLGETFREILAVSDLSAEVCGTPSQELLKATEGIPMTVYSYFQGLKKCTAAGACSSTGSVGAA